ncbi:MAG: T9SS type A sorting domain-containing protein [Saprospiraceae bacterium]|uniref:T9SS type A sorting domain-containing protein n=1 Tax=Candidatus Opimibacter skivensis TaxID=2982028 RepID=A0A9D7XQ88_9BACT|nr:T9SS type A sorting domain-containing protein [Candidatus Opimibacter skivensis]
MSRVSILVLFIITSYSSFGQQVLSKIEIPGRSWTQQIEYMIHDTLGNYYIGTLNDDTELEGVIVGGAFVSAHRNDPEDRHLFLSDFFLLKLNDQDELLNSFVIDNAESIRDYYSNGTNTVISMTLNSAELENSLYPITLGGNVVIPREGNRGKGLLIVLDENLNLLKAVLPSTGELGQVTVDENFAYLEFMIRDHQPFILIGSDTVYNHVYADNPTDYGRQTVVLCKYDFVNDKVEWWRRIGNVGREELYDMEIDKDHNLLIRGTTSSTYFSYNGIDTVMNDSNDNPFIGKYTPEGVNISGILNPFENNLLVDDYCLDKDGNYYLAGTYYGSRCIVGDTVLYNPWLGTMYPYRAVVIKYNSEGVFQWVTQLEGTFEESFLQSITTLNDGNLIISGLFRYGDLLLGGQEYHHDGPSDRENAFLWILDAGTGVYKDHVMTEGKSHRMFYNLYSDKKGILNMFLKINGIDTIFNQEFSSGTAYSSDFLVKLSTDFLSYLQEPIIQKDIFKLYPNPISQSTNVNIEFNKEFQKEESQYVIMDQRGHEVLSGNVDSNQEQFQVETKSLMPGAYWIIVNKGNVMDVELIIIQ